MASTMHNGHGNFSVVRALPPHLSIWVIVLIITMDSPFYPRVGSRLQNYSPQCSDYPISSPSLLIKNKSSEERQFQSQEQRRRIEDPYNNPLQVPTASGRGFRVSLRYKFPVLSSEEQRDYIGGVQDRLVYESHLAANPIERF